MVPLVLLEGCYMWAISVQEWLASAEQLAVEEFLFVSLFCYCAAYWQECSVLIHCWFIPHSLCHRQYGGVCSVVFRMHTWIYGQHTCSRSASQEFGKMGSHWFFFFWMFGFWFGFLFGFFLSLGQFDLVLAPREYIKACCKVCNLCLKILSWVFLWGLFVCF